MLQDRYGFALSTASPEARDAYVAGVDLSLSANHGAEEQFRRAIALDDGLAVAHAALARTLQVQHKPAEARAAAARARELAAALPHRERSHAIALATTVDGGSVAGLAAVKEHLGTYPRDAMVLAPCTGVFGLIGFSGRPGREAELLALGAAGRRLRRRLVVHQRPRLRPGRGRRRRPRASHHRALARAQPAQRQRLPHPRPRLLRKRRAGGGPRLSRGVVARLPEGEPAALPPELAHRAVAHGARPRA